MDTELRDELLARAAADQEARNSLPPSPTAEDFERTVAPVDEENTAWLRQVIADHGWPGIGLVGDEGSQAAWLLVQHGPPDFQEECLPLLQGAVDDGDASIVSLAYLRDRVLTHRGDPQIYGTQYTKDGDGELTLWPVEDPDGLDERRAEIGLEPEAVNRERIRGTR